ncbi:unnamed protein product, partial [Didymodactylos carnosus]
EYSAASPDLNATESVWSWMNHFVQQGCPNSQRRLEQLVTDAWHRIPQTVIRGYIHHIQDMCDQVVSNQGWARVG